MEIMENEEEHQGECLNEDMCQLSSSSLEYWLSNDDWFLGFFNAFLSLQSWPQKLIYNKKYRRFEEFRKDFIGNEQVGKKSAVSQNAVIEDKCVTKLKYVTKTLDQKHGLQWVKKNRFPLFLKSQFFAEYKLSKLLAEAQVNHLKQIIGVAENVNEVIRSDDYQSMNNNGIEKLVPEIKTGRRSRKISCNIIYDQNVDPSLNLNPQENIDIPEKRHNMVSLSDEKTKINPSSNMTNLNRSKLIPKADLDGIESDSQLYKINQEYVKGEGYDKPDNRPPSDHKILSVESNDYHSITPLRGCSGRISESLEEVNVVRKPRPQNGHTLKRTTSMASIPEQNRGREAKQSHTKLIEEVARILKEVDNSFADDLQHGSDWLKKLDLRTKEGIDTLKLFLLDSTAENYLQLWLDIEYLTCLRKDEIQFQLNEIKHKYFVCNAVYELPKDVKSTVLRQGKSMIEAIELFHYQKLQLKAILNYWCARFTLHIWEQIRKDSPLYGSINFHNSRSTKKAYQRPHSSAPICRQLNCSKESEFEEKVRQGTTVGKLRSKSAHARLLTIPNIEETNAGYQQLKLQSAPITEKPGFSKNNSLAYKNNSYTKDNSYFESVRLLITPTLPSNCPDVCSERANVNTAYKPKDGDILDTLLYEKYNGGQLEEFITNNGNKNWINCFDCWKNIKDYHDLFYAEKFSPISLQRKAHTIFSIFLLHGAKKDITLPSSSVTDIKKRLDPPYEDLFDVAELHVIQVLKKAWELMKSLEYDNYSQIEIEKKVRYIQVERKIKSLPRPVFDESKEETPIDSDNDSDEEGLSEGKIPTRLLNAKIPIPDDGLTFETLLHDEELRSAFELFLEENHIQGFKDYYAWQDMEKIRTYDENKGINLKHELGKAIRRKWLGKSYFFGEDSPASKAGQLQVLSLAGSDIQDERDLPASPPPSLILKAQQYAKARLQWLFLSMFRSTKEYSVIEKQRNKEQAEDIMMKRRLQKNENAWKAMHSRSSPNSNAALEFRSILSDKIKRDTFQKFLSLKRDCRENDLYFWMEIQAFKNLCHEHVDDFIYKRKIHAIIDVFIKSSVPPELRINIPIEVGDRLYEKVRGRVPNYGPYIFRESQTSIFQCLLSYWKEFQEFCENKIEDSIPNEIENLVGQQLANIKNRKLKQERRRLYKLANEKKKRDYEKLSRGRFIQDTMSVISETATVSSENQWETRPFSYSKLLAPGYLKQIESEMKEGGLTLENLEEQQKGRCKSRRRSHLPVFYREHSMLSERSQTSQKTFITEIGRLSITSENDERSNKGAMAINIKTLPSTTRASIKTHSRRREPHTSQNKNQESGLNRIKRCTTKSKDKEETLISSATVIVL